MSSTLGMAWFDFQNVHTALLCFFQDPTLDYAERALKYYNWVILTPCTGGRGSHIPPEVEKMDHLRAVACCTKMFTLGNFCKMAPETRALSFTVALV